MRFNATAWPLQSPHRPWLTPPTNGGSRTRCVHSKGRGNWLLKPARIDNGQIRFSARWKVRFSDGGACDCMNTYMR